MIPERQEFYTPNDVNKTQYYLAYRKVLRKMIPYLQDKKQHYIAAQTIPTLPHNQERAINKIERILDNMETRAVNVKRLNTALEWMEEGDYISAIRKILKAV